MTREQRSTAAVLRSIRQFTGVPWADVDVFIDGDRMELHYLNSSTHRRSAMKARR